MKDLQNLAPGGKGTAVIAFVLIHGFHEDNFFIGIIALAGGGIDLASPLSLVAAVLSLAAFHLDRNILLTTIAVAAVASPAIRNCQFQPVLYIAHGKPTSLDCEQKDSKRPRIKAAAEAAACVFWAPLK
jgi:hypothetical protein